MKEEGLSRLGETKARLVGEEESVGVKMTRQLKVNMAF